MTDPNITKFKVQKENNFKIQKDMETKILQSFNLIRRGGGARLNLFRYTAMVIMLLTLGVGNAWA